MIRNLLQGKPLGHPLHPAIVHLPIGLWMLSLVFDIASHIADDGNWLVRGAFYTMVFGVVGALLAALPGFADYSDIARDRRGHRVATWHMILNLVAVVLYFVNLWLRRDGLDAGSTGWVPLGLSVVAVGLVNVSGYLGGILVYDEGIGVGRHRRGKPNPGPARKPQYVAAPGDGFVPVADEADLRDGESIRAEVNGYAMAIVRADGQVAAFQDFCTHRFGPLSEGCFKDGRVQCPWHNSRFDMGSGRVVDGPAKVDLKVFPAEIRDGRIFVKVPPEPPSVEG